MHDHRAPPGAVRRCTILGRYGRCIVKGYPMKVQRPQAMPIDARLCFMFISWPIIEPNWKWDEQLLNWWNSMDQCTLQVLWMLSRMVCSDLDNLGWVSSRTKARLTLWLHKCFFETGVATPGKWIVFLPTGSATYHQVFRFTFHQQQNMHKTNNRNYYRTIPIPVVDKTHNYLNSTKTQIQHQTHNRK